MRHQLLFATLPVLMLVGCAQAPTTADATADFCQNLASLKQELASLGTLTPNSTVGEFNTTRDRIKIAFDKLNRSATVLQNVKVDDLKKAEENFNKTVSNISPKDTLADAATQVQQAGAEVEAARAQVSSTVSCP
ncbi:hypothetical protein [Leptolyngbya ohadii]|uniref:hypothetical protein n=1 Tax=Leptolyngbya ohadii TaxID=1962290 RepID=UPI000B59E60F|nr:hypothetical protein [Leptolyngbya ohadii]